MQNVIAKFNTVDDLDTIADVKDTRETLIQIFLGRTQKLLIVLLNMINLFKNL